MWDPRRVNKWPFVAGESWRTRHVIAALRGERGQLTIDFVDGIGRMQIREASGLPVGHRGMHKLFFTPRDILLIVRCALRTQLFILSTGTPVRRTSTSLEIPRTIKGRAAQVRLRVPLFVNE